MSLFDAAVDLNPHQIEAALFVLHSPISRHQGGDRRLPEAVADCDAAAELVARAVRPVDADRRPPVRRRGFVQVAVHGGGLQPGRASQSAWRNCAAPPCEDCSDDHQVRTPQELAVGVVPTRQARPRLRHLSHHARRLLRRLGLDWPRVAQSPSIRWGSPARLAHRNGSALRDGHSSTLTSNHVHTRLVCWCPCSARDGARRRTLAANHEGAAARVVRGHAEQSRSSAR